MVQKELFDNI